jgi:hypothetical protein
MSDIQFNVKTVNYHFRLFDKLVEVFHHPKNFIEIWPSYDLQRGMYMDERLKNIPYHYYYEKYEYFLKCNNNISYAAVYQFWNYLALDKNGKQQLIDWVNKNIADGLDY